jgi:predicted Zn-dependent protease
VSERPTLPWAFRVVDDPVVNAFALPGGFIYITRGILAHFNSEAQLVAVLGHEVGHVTARHSASQISQQQLAQVGRGVGSILSPDIEQFSGLASAALGVLFLKHSRADESQADDLGLRYMRRSDFAVAEMPGVFSMLERVSGQSGGRRTPEWLATHPAPANRREHITQAIAALPARERGSMVNRDAFLDRIDGIVFGPDPREGYFKDDEFLHPELRFRLTFPNGWNTQNQKQAVVAVTPGGDGMLELTLTPDKTADAAARAFLYQQGLDAGSPFRGPINGLTAVTAEFRKQSRGGWLRGYVAFVELDGQVYRLLAVGAEARWHGYQGTAVRAIDTFRRLTDRAVLDVRPWRIKVVTVPRATSLAQLLRDRGAPVKLETLAVLNQLDAGATLAAGDRVKWVAGDPLP